MVFQDLYDTKRGGFFRFSSYFDIRCLLGDRQLVVQRANLPSESTFTISMYNKHVDRVVLEFTASKNIICKCFDVKPSQEVCEFKTF